MQEKGAKLEEVLAVVYHSDKKRFRLGVIRGTLYIGACQGHSMEVEEDQVYTRVDPSEVPSIIHATCYDFYASILKTGIKPGGGNPRTRGHIHCLRDHVSQHRFFPPGVEIILHLEHAAHTVRWYLTDNGYFVTPDTVPAAAITAVTIIASGQRVSFRDHPPPAASIAMAMACAPSGSRAYMTSLPGKVTARPCPVMLQLGSPPKDCHLRSHMATGGHLLQTLLSLACTLALHIGILRCSRECQIRQRWICRRIRPGCYRRIRSTSFSNKPRNSKQQSVTPEHGKGSRAGPKSSGPCIRRRMLWYLVLVSHLVQSTTAVAAGADARVAVSTGITAGAVHHEHKHCQRGGENIGKAIERKHGGGIRWTAKRALRRARARAAEQGGTHYRGQWYSSEHLGCTTRGLSTLPTKTKEANGRKHTTEPNKGDKRIKALTWNMSGASSAAWQELMAWLEQHQQSIDVALIQETHWRNEGSRDFESGPWNVLTTGCSAKDSKAGLAVLVHKRMGRAEMLSARTLLQSRIQHVRIHQGVNSADIINVYQHVWRSQEDRESNLKCRASVWSQLRQVTAHIPQRNTLLIGGDFNCTVRRLQGHVGSALSPVREAANDQEDFLSYLQDYGLSILNTWNARPAHTCHTGDARTQIDFLITRVQHADAIAKHSAPWHTAPVGRWKANHHVPVWSSIRQVHPCKFRSKQAGQPARAPIQESIAAEDVQSQLLKQLVEDTLRQETWDGSMEQTAERLDAVLNDCVRTVYPPKSRPDDRLFTQPTYQLKLKNMWAVYADYKRARVATMGNILHKWKLLTTFHKASKLFREHAKLAKRTKITRVAGELAEASAKGDQRGIWQGAKKLAPWKPRTKMSIRGPEGTILSPEEQLQALLDYSTRKFCHGDPYISEHRMHADFTLTEQEVERLVSKTPLRKAVPESVAPSAVWKLCAASISQVIVHAILLGCRTAGPDPTTLEGFTASLDC